jgi:hypothetical protein
MTTCMVSDQQVKRLWLLAMTLSLEVAAAKAGMDPKTARKYLGDRRLPNEMRQEHTWRTRPDPFEETWEEVRQLLITEPSLQAKPCLSICREGIPGGSEMGKCGHCGAEPSIGGPRKDCRGRSSLPKSIDLVSCVNQTLRTAVSWASR